MQCNKLNDIYNFLKKNQIKINRYVNNSLDNLWTIYVCITLSFDKSNKIYFKDIIYNELKCQLPTNDAR